MNYSELIQAYFERSVALQWYWTIYVVAVEIAKNFNVFPVRFKCVNFGLRHMVSRIR